MIAPLFQYLRSNRDEKPIDPAKVARVLLDVVEMAEPPLHLVLGRDAVDRIRACMGRQMVEDERWAQVGRSVDFD